MPTDGLAAVQERIADIHARVAAYAPSRPPVAPQAAPQAAPPSSSQASAFEQAYSVATDAVARSADAPASWSTPAAAAAPAGLTPAVRRAPGDYGRLVPPEELTKYGNGRIPAGALTPIGVGSHRLWNTAAAAFQRMAADAAAQGVKIGVTDSYRSYDQQVDLAARKGLYGQGGWAAVPGRSNHGWGMALDVDVDARGQQWLRDNAHRYGWVESVPREPWHWEYRPA